MSSPAKITRHENPGAHCGPEGSQSDACASIESLLKTMSKQIANNAFGQTYRQNSPAQPEDSAA